jgi:environmental stress-induced protein Ves
MIPIIPFQKQLSSEWTGGSTIQLFIFPPQSSYAERNFLARISTATIRIPKSDFTSLPGYNRLLLVLEGNLNIKHQEAHQITLHPYDTDQFKGDWHTSSEGLATDFNIIHKPEVEARVSVHKLDTGQQLIFPSSPAYRILFLHGGQGNLLNEFETMIYKERDTCYINPTDTIQFEATAPSILIESTLTINNEA